MVREHNAFADARCARSIDNQRHFVGVNLYIGKRSIFGSGVVLFKYLIEPFPITERNNLFKTLVLFFDFFGSFGKVVLAKQHFDIGVVEQLAGLLDRDIGGKRNNDVSAENHAGQAS